MTLPSLVCVDVYSIIWTVYPKAVYHTVNSLASVVFVPDRLVDKVILTSFRFLGNSLKYFESGLTLPFFLLLEKLDFSLAKHAG